MFGVISDNELIFQPHIRIAKTNIFLRPWKEKSLYPMQSLNLTLATVC